MGVVFKRTEGLTEKPFHYCPGCTHGIIHRLAAEAMEELDLLDTAVGIAPVGCSVFCYNYFNCDMQEAAHGRAPAVATGIKRVCPELTVFTYQGDGGSGLDRNGGDRPCGNEGRKNNHHICQQCDLWNDRRSDGADHFDRPESYDRAFWERGKPLPVCR